MAESNTKICNQALARIGSLRINNYEDTDESSAQAIQARLHFEPTRDALLKSFYWPFAGARAELSEDTNEPDFEWENQFILPTDFLYLRSIYDGSPAFNSTQSHAIEGKRFLTNDSAAKIRYTKKVTDASQFDPLFVQVLVLQLALKFAAGLAKTDPKLRADIKEDLKILMPSVRAVSRQEANLKGREDQHTWNDARYRLTSRIDSQMGS